MIAKLDPRVEKLIAEGKPFSFDGTKVIVAASGQWGTSRDHVKWCKSVLNSDSRLFRQFAIELDDYSDVHETGERFDSWAQFTVKFNGKQIATLRHSEDANDSWLVQYANIPELKSDMRKSGFKHASEFGTHSLRKFFHQLNEAVATTAAVTASVRYPSDYDVDWVANLSTVPENVGGHPELDRMSHQVRDIQKKAWKIAFGPDSPWSVTERPGRVPVHKWDPDKAAKLGVSEASISLGAANYLPTNNKRWGFYGTALKSLPGMPKNWYDQIWNKASAVLFAKLDGDPSPEEVRDLLDSSLGRHWVDAIPEAASWFDEHENLTPIAKDLKAVLSRVEQAYPAVKRMAEKSLHDLRR